MPNPNIRIARGIAYYIWQEAKNLVAAGYAQNLHGDPLEAETALINGIDDSTEAFRYFDTLIRFVRYVARLMEHELLDEDTENVTPEDYMDILGEFNDNGEI